MHCPENKHWLVQMWKPWSCVSCFQKTKSTIWFDFCLNIYINTTADLQLARGTLTVTTACSCSAQAQTQWRGCVFTVFSWAADHVCAHYTVSCCWCHHRNQGEAGGRSVGESFLRVVLIPLVWVNVVVDSNEGTLHWFMLCVSYGQLWGHWGNWWPFKRKQPSWVAYSVPEREKKES